MVDASGSSPCASSIQPSAAGTIEFLSPDNPRILAFVRQLEDERLLVVANLSRFAQSAELDLSPYQGLVPVELFGRTAFPVVQSTRISCPSARTAFSGFT